MSNNVGINISAASKETLDSVKDIILSILNSQADNKTRISALETLRAIVKIENIAISNCTVSMAKNNPND